MHFHGIYDKTIFRNESDGYTIFTVNSKEADKYKSENGTIMCCGIIPICTKGIPLLLTGNPVKKNNKFTIKVSEICVSSNNEEITIQYLSGEAFKGIGRKTAEKIVKLTGNDIFAFIEKPDAEEQLNSLLPELKNEIIHSLIITIRNTLSQRDIIEFLQRSGGTYSQALELYEKYKSNAIKVLKENPYGVGHEVGIPFCVCDYIARNENFYYLNEKRIEAIIYEAMNVITNNGNTYTTPNELFHVVDILSKHSAFPIEIPSLLITAHINNCKSLSCREEFDVLRIYQKKFLNFENNILSDLIRLKHSTKPLPFKDTFIEEIEEKYNIKYSDSQKKTFNFLKSSGLKILCGHAGTGKTTIQKGLIAAFTKMFPDSVISLCAPTGRAAQRMSSATGLPALTIHKLLDIQPFKGDDYKCKDRNNQLESDLIIVDEASMIDIELFNLLLQATKNGATVILCGDPSQLQSVGPGNILLDMINSEKFAVNTLDVVYRQAENSKIIKNANSIRNGIPTIENGQDFELIKVRDQIEIKDKVLEIYKKHFDVKNPFNLQVLSSVKKGDSGVYSLNKEIQSQFNDTEDKVAFGKMSYRIGDMVMMLSNNYELDYYNGEIGIIKDIEDGSITIEIDNKTINLPSKLLKDITLAYAATVHKSQGSEFPIVIIALAQYPSGMLNRNLLYTAVTRAKSKVYIISQDNAIDLAIEREMINSRKTALCEKIKRSV